MIYHSYGFLAFDQRPGRGGGDDPGRATLQQNFGRILDASKTPSRMAPPKTNIFLAHLR